MKFIRYDYVFDYIIWGIIFVDKLNGLIMNKLNIIFVYFEDFLYIFFVYNWLGVIGYKIFWF